jgi:prepilin-type N-terminal cleavage/methylation domain-containing protein
MMEYRQLTHIPAAARALLYPYPGGFAMKDRRGFTLLEIMIVIMIVGIMAIIATTNFFSWQNHYGGVGFQREFLSQFNEARTRSVATSLQHHLLINSSDGSVKLERWNSVLNQWEYVPGKATKPPLGSGAGISDVVCTPTVSVPSSFALLFNPNGEVLVQTNTLGTAAATLTQADIHLSAASVADRATIRVFGWTSKARLFNGWN